MYRYLFIFLFFPYILVASPPKVIVTVAPTKFLVEKIAGNRVEVEKFVPAGASPHSFEPTSRQLLEASKGVLWFRIGEGFEGRTLDVFKGKTKLVNLRDGLPLISGQSCRCHPQDPHDPHIWLSTHLLKIQSKTITQALSDLLPESKSFFEENLTALVTELDILDNDIKAMVAKSPRQYILVTHPAFGYFCRDYGLVQLSIEVDGKEPTPRQMTDLIQLARTQKIDRLFLEPQHNAKGGIRIAQELNIQTYWLDPYKENVIENLKTIAKAFTES